MRTRTRDELEYGRLREGFCFEFFIEVSSRKWPNNQVFAPFLPNAQESILSSLLPLTVARLRSYSGAPFYSRENFLLERVFHIQENQTTVRRELLAGLTTFMTAAYVVVVNPRILSEAGMPGEGVLFATCISSAIATLIMGLWANYPIALAPGMSLNAYFTYSIVLGRGVPWQTALGVVFLSGLLFLLLTLTNVREQIVNGIPNCLKYGTAAGIGLFIAFIGLRNANIIVANQAKSSQPLPHRQIIRALAVAQFPICALIRT